MNQVKSMKANRVYLPGSRSVGDGLSCCSVPHRSRIRSQYAHWCFLLMLFIV